jgi:hypothetical protein
MKKFYEKQWLYKTILSVLFVACFFLDFGLLRVKLASPFNTISLWDLPQGTVTATEGEKAFALALVIAFFVSLVPLGLSLISFFKKTPVGFYLVIGYFILYQIAVFVFQGLALALTLNSLALAIAALVLILIALALVIGQKAYGTKDAPEVKQGEAPSTEVPANEAPIATPNGKHASVALLVMDIIGIVLLFIGMFFVPIYTISSGSASKTCTIAQVLFSKDSSIDDTVYFLIALILVLITLFYFISFFSSFLSAKKRFAHSSKNLMVLLVGFALAYFLMGFIVEFVYALKGYRASSLSFIPLVLEGLLSIPFAIFKGRFDLAEGDSDAERANKEARSPRRNEPLIFVILVTLVTLGSLFLNFVDVKIKSGTSVIQEIQMTGIKLLSDFSVLGGGYQTLTFIIVVMIICSGLGLIMTLCSYLAHYKNYANIAKITTYVNLFFIFVFGISGLYFTIATKVTVDSTEALIKNYCPAYSSGSYTYEMRTDTFYALIVDMVIWIAMLLRKALDGSSASQPLLQGVPASAGSEEKKAALEEKEEGSVGDFDPCPAFSEIDSKQASYQEDLAKREQSEVTNPNLADLVRFVVDYAKNSRLHLSYSAQDIAAFVAGLGAARLTILQGMSGTGKTSLPKIFMEAIAGDCDIVEVESSWKDKNELLGYYNEFSALYTPKKFTQALYKAALNPEVPTFIVLDEMNLSRIEYYFSDFLSLMENGEGHREIKLLNISLEKHANHQVVPYAALSEGHTLKVPSNVWFVGTANRDESTFVISDKVYDRAHTMNFNKRAPKVRDFKDPLSPRFYRYESLAKLFADAKSKGSFDAENNETIKKVESLLAPYNISFGNRILVQIEDFVDIYKECFPGWDVESQAVETILLSKVVSKLEVKTIDDKDSLVKEFVALNLNKCADFIAKLNED